MDLTTALRTTGAVREFSDEAVADDVVYRILDTARFAPSGGNRQAWRVVLVRDPDKKRRLRDLYLHGWYEYLAMGHAGLVPWAPVTDREAEAKAKNNAADVAAAAAPNGFAEQLHLVPVLLVVLADLRGLAAVDRDHDRYTLVGGASIYPFTWSILLAARGEGLGGVFTTMLVREEESVLEMLGAPAEYALAGAVALGHPKGGQPTRLRRTPVDKFTSLDCLDGDPLTG